MPIKITDIELLANQMTSTQAVALAAGDADTLERKAARHWIYRQLDPGRQAATRRWWDVLGIDSDPVEVVTPQDLVDELGYSLEQAKEELAADGLLLPWMN